MAQDQENKWYCLRVISNKERKIKERLDVEVERNGLANVVTQVVVPTEKVYKIKNGKKAITERNMLPGYLLIEANPKLLTPDAVQQIHAVKDVMHFLGHQTPTPMKLAEVNRLLGKIDESAEEGETLIEPFIIGESVKIIEGSFNEFIGTIEEIDDEKKKLKVSVKIFGRPTPVELTFMQVEKQA